MMNNLSNAVNPLSKVTVSLHWLVALGMISLLAIGMYMDSFKAYFLYPIHKSFGILILLLVVPRIIWRAIKGWPTPVGQYSKTEHNLTHIVHWLLIIGTLLMPISGMMMSGAGGHGLFIFDWELLAKNVNPDNPRMAMPIDKNIAMLGKQLHGIGGYLISAALVLHVAGALKHHIIDKDATLRRMFGRRS